jgi:hypothetical protein
MYFSEQGLIVIAMGVFILLCFLNMLQIKEMLAIDKECKYLCREIGRLRQIKYQLENEIKEVKGE